MAARLPTEARADEAAPDPLRREVLLAGCGLQAFEQLAATGSTMDRAREWAADPAALLPVAIVADRQTAGRGRRQAGWWQAPGSLAMSLVLEGAAVPGGSGPRPSWSLACGVALAEAVAALEPELVPRVRWPNDVEVLGRKLAGILVETVAGSRLIFGIGVNTSGSSRQAPDGLQKRLITLPDLTGRVLPREVLLLEFVPRFLRLLVEVEQDPAVLRQRYQPLCALTGQDVVVHQADGRKLRGRCQGIASDGSLVLDTVAGRLHLLSGSLTDPADVWRDDQSISPA